ncbi:MAG: hypothetical protein HXY49_02185 [Ignavibacteriaceae bacterium]|nr:hypothetical protein [Ignavibacteriaceae bacterium]
MKKNISFIFLLFSISSVNIYAQEFSISIFPEEKLFSTYYADAVAHQFSLSKSFKTSEWYGNIGALIPFLNVSLLKQNFQISAGATAFNTLIKTPGHITVFTVDYLVDFFVDSRIAENFTGRFIWGHLSAHFADDGITILNANPVSYVRDYAGLHFQHSFNNVNGKIYSGVFYNFHNEPVLDQHFTFQIGGDAGVQMVNKIIAYASLDIKFKSEVNYGTTQSYQVGLIYPSFSNRSLRFAITHRRGFEERGQLFNLKDNKTMAGIYFDF